MRQVLSEMTANAIKFAYSGSRVSIHTCQQGSWIEIEIANTGTPIDAAQRKTIFEKFSQGDQSMTREAGGCGLGLFLVYNIVRLHGGQVELVDREGRETAFVVRMPAPPAP